VPDLEPLEQLRDAYIALGSAISDLRSLPLRNHVGIEEDLHFTSARRAISEAQISSQLASDALGNVAAKIEVEPRSFGSARALARSVVWE